MKDDLALNENEISKDENTENEEDKKVNKLKDFKEQLFERLNTAENARIKRNISLFLQKYARVTIYGIIVLLMLIVCLASVINQKRNVDAEGAVMSMTELAANTKPFAGKSFDADVLTYDDMLEIEGDTIQLSDTDRKKVNQILAGMETPDNGDKSQSITLGEYVAVVEQTTEQAQTTDTTSSVTASSSVTSSSSLVSNPVYATADGTYEYLGEFLLTAYCPCPICCGAYSNMVTPTTASGTIAAANRTVAVDTSMIPFGTELLINGQVYIAEDRGSAITGNHIDIFFSTHEEATNWGKQYAAVYKKLTASSDN